MFARVHTQVFRVTTTPGRPLLAEAQQDAPLLVLRDGEQELEYVAKPGGHAAWDGAGAGAGARAWAWLEEAAPPRRGTGRLEGKLGTWTPLLLVVDAHASILLVVLVVLNYFG